MSTIAYGLLTTRRERSKPGTSSSDSPPGVKSYVDAMAALIPAEVLTLHALFLSVTTETKGDPGGESITTITDPETLRLAFYGLVITSIVLYLAARWKRWRKGDVIRAGVVPLAFLAWTMLQKSTAFDAFGFGITEARRTVYALFLAVGLGVVSALLAKAADASTVTNGGQAGNGQPPENPPGPV